MDWVALFGKINYPLALMVIETAICFRHARRKLHWLWWPLCAALILAFSVVGNQNWQFVDHRLSLQVILNNLPVRTLIAAATAVQLWLCFSLSAWDALGVLTIGLCCQKMQFAFYKVMEAALDSALPGGMSEAGSVTLDLLLLVLTALLVGLVFRKSRWHLDVPPHNRSAIILTLMILLALEALDLMLLSSDPYATSGKVMVAGRLSSILTHFTTLYMMYNLIGWRTLQMEQEAMEAIAEQRRSQYAFSQELINTINVKSHDLKKQLRYLKANRVAGDELIAELEDTVENYDSFIQTNNETLSTVLSEKSLLCRRHDIPFSCVADGSSLGFMKPLDIYTLFANLMDNAIEASLNPALTHRCINLVVRQQAGFLSVHEENYCAGEFRFQDGLPRTSKADERYHGFGTRSMRQLAEKYGGTIAMKVEDGVFTVNILIPIETA